MNVPKGDVLVIEGNQTRADLYDLWLGSIDVRIALTEGQVHEEMDQDVAVVLLNQELTDGGSELLQLVRERNPSCYVVTTTTDRAQTIPKLDVDNHLVKPVFKDELREKVRRLLLRYTYMKALKEYYRLTVSLTTEEIKSKTDEGDAEDVDTIDRRIQQYKSILSDLRQSMEPEDIEAVLDQVSSRHEPSEEAGVDKTESKYCPKKCSRCGRSWNNSQMDDWRRGYRRLGSFVWRCVDCGHVQMLPAGGNQRVAPSR
jgi:DNA-binding response OmpR family regulator